MVVLENGARYEGEWYIAIDLHNKIIGY